MTNYKKEYGLTLQEAKTRSMKILGRMPKMGYEVCVEYGNKYINGHFHEYRIYLSNRSGALYLWQWVNVNYASSESKIIPE